MEIKRILVPMDFSACSKNALTAAINLAQKWNCEIRVVHSTFLPSSTVGVGDEMIQPIPTSYDESEDPLEELEMEFPLLEGIPYETKQYHSVVTDAIYSEIENNEIDLVVMGTKGTHDILEKLLGGITVSVIEFGKIPVLVIPENVTKLDISRIAIAADFHKIETDSFKIIKKIAEIFKGEIQIFNIGNEEERMNFKHSKSKDILDKYFGDFKLSYHQLIAKDASSAIFEYIKDYEIDLLVMFPRHHKLMERMFKSSETKKVAMKIKIPMLAIHQ